MHFCFFRLRHSTTRMRLPGPYRAGPGPHVNGPGRAGPWNFGPCRPLVSRMFAANHSKLRYVYPVGFIYRSAFRIDSVPYFFSILDFFSSRGSCIYYVKFKVLGSASNSADPLIHVVFRYGWWIMATDSSNSFMLQYTVEKSLGESLCLMRNKAGHL